MSARLVLNPVAGADEALAVVARINDRLRPRFDDLDIVITTGPGDAERAAARAAMDGREVIFAAGGDGTVNEVLNGVYDSGRLGSVTLGVIPLGTGNDFAGALGIPEELDAALDALTTDRVAPIDVGRLDDRVFVNVSAGGFIAEVSDAVTPGLKTLAGKLAYLIGGAEALFSYEPVRASLEASGAVELLNPGGVLAGNPRRGAAPAAFARECDLQLFAVCNSRLVGGGRVIAPEAFIDDGWLDVCVIEAMPTLEFVALLRQVATGGHLEDRRVSYFRIRDLRLRFSRPIKVNTDGQVLEASSCRYTVLPKAARFLAPAPLYSVDLL